MFLKGRAFEMVNERKDYVVAFVIGAVVGIGATLLLKPPTRTERIVRQIEPRVRRLRKRGRRLRKTLKRAL